MLIVLTGLLASISIASPASKTIPTPTTPPSAEVQLVLGNPSGATVSRINSDTRTIAACMPNRSSIRTRDWRSFVTTIRKVEAATGYDFLSVLSSSIQDALETSTGSEATTRAGTNPCE